MQRWAWELDCSPHLGDGAEGITWVDIETRKVEVGPGSAFPFRRRWQTFMVGMAGIDHLGTLHLEVVAGDEAEVLDYLRAVTEEPEGRHEIRYQATRDFDQMVLRGRFSHARAALLPAPTGEWPHLDDLAVRWTNQRKIARPLPVERPFDLPSRDVPGVWDDADAPFVRHVLGHDPDRTRDLVALHCARDVAVDVLSDPTIPVIPELAEWLASSSVEGAEDAREESYLSA